MAVAARDALREAEGTVEFSEYAGGHGWQDEVIDQFRKGIGWLEAQAEQ
jgi:predicted esterase